jgi:pimeloyl-ACP methyl ester carboxylesterase
MNLAQWRAQAEFQTFKAQAIACWRGGDWDDPARPGLLLIHGFPTASFDWQALWPSLCEKFRVLAVDLLGFGFSAKPRSWDYSIFEQADLLEHMAAHYGLGETHVLAHDYGDTVAQELLARMTDAAPAAIKLQSLCLLNGGLFPETHRATRMQRVLKSPVGFLAARLMNESNFSRSFVPVFGPDTQPSQAALQDYWAQISAGAGTQGIVHRLIGYIGERRENRSRWVGALERSSTALRVICGAQDPISGAHMAQRYRQLVPQADVVLLEGIGHYPQVEAPEQVLAAFAQFHAALQ